MSLSSKFCLFSGVLSLFKCIESNADTSTCGSSTCDNFSDDYFFSLPGPIVASQDNIVGNVNIGSQLQVSFDLVLNSLDTSGYWRSIISVGESDYERIPSFYLYPNDNKLAIRFQTINDGTWNSYGNYDTSFELSVGTSYHIVLQICDGTISAYVNSDLIKTQTFTSTTTGDNRPIYINRVDSWDNTQFHQPDVTITNIDIRPCIEAIPCAYSHSCNVWGDPHFTTFDGTTHHFQGDGYFDYVKVCNQDNSIELPFVISAKHGDCGYNPYLCIMEMIATIIDPVTDQTTIISFPSSGSPTFKDTGLSASGIYYFNDNSGYYTIKDNVFEIIFDDTNNNNDNFEAKLRFYYSGWTLVLQTSDCLSDTICGLCGYLNDDSSDDFTRCDNNDVIDNTGSAIVKPYVNAGTAWTNTNIFGESCCNLDLDTLYIGTSNCDPDDPPEPPTVPNTECLEKAETICSDAFYIDCTLCDNKELTDEWLSNCGMDVCAIETCKTNILNDNYDVNDVRDAGCLDSVLDGCKKVCRETLTPTVLPTGSPVLPTMSPTIGTFILPQEFHKDYTWIEALEYCEDVYGTTLATVSSMEQLEELSQLALNMRNEDDEDDADGLKYWIGLSDIDKDGTWHWTDGIENDWDEWNTESRFRYTNNGYCAQIRYRMLNSRSTGSSIDCDQTRYFVCDSPTVE